MQALDDLLQPCGGHRHLIAPGRSAGAREEPHCHGVINHHRARVRQFARTLDQPRADFSRTKARSIPHLAICRAGPLETRHWQFDTDMAAGERRWQSFQSIDPNYEILETVESRHRWLGW